MFPSCTTICTPVLCHTRRPSSVRIALGSACAVLVELLAAPAMEPAVALRRPLGPFTDRPRPTCRTAQFAHASETGRSFPPRPIGTTSDRAPAGCWRLRTPPSLCTIGVVQRPSRAVDKIIASARRADCIALSSAHLGMKAQNIPGDFPGQPVLSRSPVNKHAGSTWVQVDSIGDPAMCFASERLSHHSLLNLRTTQESGRQGRDWRKQRKDKNGRSKLSAHSRPPFRSRTYTIL